MIIIMYLRKIEIGKFIQFWSEDMFMLVIINTTINWWIYPDVSAHWAVGTSIQYNVHVKINMTQLCGVKNILEFAQLGQLWPMFIKCSEEKTKQFMNKLV